MTRKSAERVCLRRREFLAGAGAAGSVLLGARPGRGAAAPQVRILEARTISLQPHYYRGWPTLARRRNGQLLVAYSGGREGHVCPFGRVELIQSNDGGARVAHSLVQATGNVIPIRFSVFALGSLVLLALLVRTALRLA